jgi:hypothetical protein
MPYVTKDPFVKANVTRARIAMESTAGEEQWSERVRSSRREAHHITGCVCV